MRAFLLIVVGINLGVLLTLIGLLLLLVERLNRSDWL